MNKPFSFVQYPWLVQKHFSRPFFSVTLYHNCFYKQTANSPFPGGH